jgi:NHLM bacteriocin system ABC transporter ATP-binding protein
MLNKGDLLNKKRLLTREALSRKIAQLGSCAGLLVENKADNKENCSSSLYAALQIIATEYNLQLKTIDNLISIHSNLSFDEQLKLIAEKNNWRMRQVFLSEKFYQEQSLPLLAYANNVPVVLYLKGEHSYFISADQPGKKQFINNKNASIFRREAYCFYETFPQESGNIRQMLKFIFRSAKPIMTGVMLISLASALLGLMIPITTQYITGKLIPSGLNDELMQISLLLLALTVVEMLLKIVPQLLMLFFSSRQYERFQAAVYDHILRIPLKIFRQYDAGELTSRILAASQIQNTVFSVVNGQLLGSLFTTVSLIMMFYYSRTLAWWGIIMVLCYGAVFFLLARRNLVPLALAAEAQGRISGFLQQFFSGMNKVRSAGAEQQLVNRFMDDFSKMEKAHYQASSNEIQQQVFSSCFSMVISIIFYALAGGFLDANLPLPIFLAFMASFHNFKGGLLDLSASIWTLLAIKTEINRIIPILQEKPEDDGNRNDAGLLSGKVEVSHLKFSYTPDSPLVLDDVSLKAKPGEFIAIAGASGAGKSSLFRILLGFETPNSGAIYYSDQDFANLDRNSVRCQMGVIMQNSRIIPGSILENIIQGTDASIEEAWNALEMAEFADEVRQMPMDIHTIVTPATISGGQQQRILIARALVGNPKVILMDESTSALDNISQEKITKNLQQLAVTRIVIAHRLSTIVDADCIYVLDKGKVVQCGTYETLSAKNGVFKDLIERQKTQKD